MIVLDTHAWIWWVAESAKLSARARRAIEDSDEIGVSAISLWETAMLVAKRRLELDRKVLLWIREGLARPRSILLPLTVEVCVQAAELELHGDPADRIIAATALSSGSPLITRDKRLTEYRQLKTIW